MGNHPQLRLPVGDMDKRFSSNFNAYIAQTSNLLIE
jgi:hypothetical protein